METEGAKHVYKKEEERMKFSDFSIGHWSKRSLILVISLGPHTDVRLVSLNWPSVRPSSAPFSAWSTTLLTLR